MWVPKSPQARDKGKGVAEPQEENEQNHGWKLQKQSSKAQKETIIVASTSKNNTPTNKFSILSNLDGDSSASEDDSLRQRLMFNSRFQMIQKFKLMRVSLNRERSQD